MDRSRPYASPSAGATRIRRGAAAAGPSLTLVGQLVWSRSDGSRRSPGLSDSRGGLRKIRDDSGPPAADRHHRLWARACDRAGAVVPPAAHLYADLLDARVRRLRPRPVVQPRARALGAVRHGHERRPGAAGPGCPGPTAGRDLVAADADPVERRGRARGAAGLTPDRGGALRRSR